VVYGNTAYLPNFIIPLAGGAIAGRLSRSSALSQPLFPKLKTLR